MAIQLLVWCQLLAALSYVVGIFDPTAQHRTTIQAQRGAWEVLRPCAATVSLDGNWSMTLSEDGTAEVSSRNDEQKLQGHWDLVDAKQHLYRIDVLAFGNNFAVVPSTTGCMLASGSLRTADLTLSWYTRPASDDADPGGVAEAARVATK